MGCDSSKIQPHSALKARPPIPLEAQTLIADSKFSLAEKYADDLALRQEVSLSILVYQRIIESNYLQDYQIQGLGSCELANGRYQGRILEWYHERKTKGDIKGSPYDALSLSFCKISSQHESSLKEGQAWYEQMLENVESYQLYMGYGNILCNSKKYHDAIKVYNKVIALKPTLLNAYIAIAFIYQFRKNDKVRAIQTATKILSLFPNNFYAQLIIARNEKDERIRIESLKSLANKYPEYTRINYEIGQLFDAKKDYKQALSYYKQCLEVNPFYGDCLISIGNAFQSLNQLQQASGWYLKACQLRQNDEIPHQRLCNVFQILKYRDQDVLEEIKKYSKLKLYHFYYLLGVAYYEKRQTDRSLRWLHRAESLDADDKRLQNYLGMAYDQKEDYVTAEKYYLKCIDTHPNYSNPYYNLAILYKHKKDEEKAGIWFKKAVAMNPRYKYTSHTNEIAGQKKLRFLNPIQQKRKNNSIGFLTNLLSLGSPPSIESQQVPPSNAQVIVADKKEAEQVNLNELRQNEKQIIDAVFRMFESKALSKNEASSFRSEILEIINLIHQDQFKLKQIQKIQDLVRIVMHEDEEYFHIIPLLLIKHIENSIKDGSAAKIQQEIKQIIKNLLLKEDGANVTPMNLNQINIQLKHFTPNNQPKINVLNPSEKINNCEALCSQITQASENAEKVLSEFIDLVQDVRRRSNGVEFIANLKAPKYQNKNLKYLFPIVSQIFKEDFNEGIINSTVSLVWQEIKKTDIRSISQIGKIIQKTWGQQITKIIADKNKKNQHIELDLHDLIKGKVTFYSIQDLSRGLEVADSICHLRGYQIIGLKNRLSNRDTRDIVLIIKIHENVCTFQLTLRHNEDRHHIKDRLQEIQGTLGFALGCYIFMCQKISYPLLAISKDIQKEFEKKQSADDQKTKESAKFVIQSLQKTMT